MKSVNLERLFIRRRHFKHLIHHDGLYNGTQSPGPQFELYRLVYYIVQHLFIHSEADTVHLKHFDVLFYDGIFGPGTGSFFIFYFIRYLKVDFLHASALSKIGNFMTNFAALSFFIPTGHVLFQLGLMMAVANVCGSLVGVKMALKYGSGFIRILFLILVSVLICRLAYQMFMS